VRQKWDSGVERVPGPLVVVDTLERVSARKRAVLESVGGKCLILPRSSGGGVDGDGEAAWRGRGSSLGGRALGRVSAALRTL
jgi:hypothetical protein